MVAVKYIVENRPTDFLKHIFLSALRIKDIIKHKRDLFLSGVSDDKLTLIAHSVYFISISLKLFGIEGPESAEDFYVSVSFFLHLDNPVNYNKVKRHNI